ncbi:MAG: transporter substrate-binding domain-containing protein [Devosiaceae bacterium]|nr:transporter substrate-binding domain-containing protein [Devosiaceae bacterium MH13]
MRLAVVRATSVSLPSLSGFVAAMVLALALGLALPGQGHAQQAAAEAAEETDVDGLGELRFINPRSRIVLPEPMPGPVLRFVVADDFPPFAFIDGAGRLSGAHVDLIRRLCDVLALACTVQTRQFDQVLAAVDEDPLNLVLVAGLSVSAELADDLAFSLPYFRYAGRFVALRAVDERDGWIDRARIGVLEGTAHEAFLARAYAGANVTSYEGSDDLFRALRRGDVSHVFGDGVNLAFWLAGGQSGDCCRFVGQPLFSLRYFGEGLTLAVPRGQPELIQALNAGLARLESSGELEVIMLTAFPLDPLGQ